MQTWVHRQSQAPWRKGVLPTVLTNYATMNNSLFVYTQPYLVSSEVFNKLWEESYGLWSQTPPPPLKSYVEKPVLIFYSEWWYLERVLVEDKVDSTRIVGRNVKSYQWIEWSKSLLEDFPYYLLQQRTTKQTWIFGTGSRLGSPSVY